MSQQRLFNFGVTSVSELLNSYSQGLLRPGVHTGFIFDVTDAEEGRFALAPGWLALENGVVLHETEPVPLSLGWGVIPATARWYTVYVTHVNQKITGGNAAQWRIHEGNAPILQDQLDTVVSLADDEVGLVVGWIYHPGTVPLSGAMWGARRVVQPNEWADDDLILQPRFLRPNTPGGADWYLLSGTAPELEIENASEGDVRLKFTAGITTTIWELVALMPPGGLPHQIGIWADIPSLCSISLRARPGSWQQLLGTARSNPPSTQERVYLDNAHVQLDDHYYDGWSIRFPSIVAPTAATVENYFGVTNATVLDSPLGAAPTGEDYRLTPVSVIEGVLGTGTWQHRTVGPSIADKLFHQLVVVNDVPIWRPLPTADWNRPWPLFLTVSAAPNQTVQTGLVDVTYAYRRGRMASAV